MLGQAASGAVISRESGNGEGGLAPAGAAAEPCWVTPAGPTGKGRARPEALAEEENLGLQGILKHKKQACDFRGGVSF